ncbi:dCMP deaminase [Clostridium lacusfryxellense]|uniref:dCMP deaminase n=1 Tax=Clostridium lacusfryxellense TaxID=205328 RepID=UPI001C0CE0A0|nr:dCMP deaminase [Clostridium lacusfryxellense]MBU3110172.1 dCMP deaminase [Clostridium lacusfryxellense]
MSENNVSNAVDMLFDERKNFIIIGLTGRTGSGCSKVAKILSTEKFVDLELNKSDSTKFKDNNERKDSIVYKYMEKNWRKFQTIEIRNVITSFILENNFVEFKEYMFDKHKVPVGILDILEEEYNEKHNKIIEINKKLYKKESESNEQNVSDFYIKELSIYTQRLRQELNKYNETTYTLLYQDIANNIRSSGNAFSRNFDPDNIFKLSDRTNHIIKILRAINNNSNKENPQKEGKSTLIVIDAFRNPYEATFFKDRYSAFYLFSVNCNSVDREKRIVKDKNLSPEQIKEIDNREYPENQEGEEIFSHQNIEKCNELSDVYLYNPNSYNQQLEKDILKYISLILHPGIISPTHIERCMQIAYNAKVNSGCISRQVGAIVTGENFNIKSIGWNDVPQGQVPCNLKNLLNLYPVKDEKAFSKYELENGEFKDYVKSIRANPEIDIKKVEVKNKLKGRTISYCFKDIYNGIKNDKNQVHTRSLHAEENAFLQISKYGGVKLKDGCLFTTASPCELCAKKAYQIGVKKIYYIDLYPGISGSHILNNGDKRPDLILFNGAIGRAYTQFYTPILPYKDEIYMLLNLNFKYVNMLEDSMEKIVRNLFEQGLTIENISKAVEICKQDIEMIVNKVI